MSADVRRFFLLAYALTWIFTIPFVIAWHTVFNQTMSPWVVVFLPAPFGPTFAALILVGRAEGKSGVTALLKRFTIWRAPVRWYAFALFTPAAVVTAAVAMSGFRGALAAFELGPSLTIAPLVMVGALPFGPLAEELGWRGYAQPRLMAEGGLWRTSLTIGILWTFWHIPMFAFPGAAIPSFLEVNVLSVALYLAQITAEACLMTALYVGTRGSVLLAVLYHTSFNTAETIVFRTLPDPTFAQQFQVYVISIVLSWVLAVWLLRSVRQRGGHPSPEVAPAV